MLDGIRYEVLEFQIDYLLVRILGKINEFVIGIV